MKEHSIMKTIRGLTRFNYAFGFLMDKEYFESLKS